MKPLDLVAISALALTAAACGPKVPAARAALDCPMTQGDLTRTGATSDGQSCTYATKAGAEVTLRLVSTANGVDAALNRIETDLLAGRIKPSEAAAAEAAQPVAAEATEDAKKASAQATADAKGVEMKVTVDGKPVDADVTRVDLPGIHIVANEKDETAQVRVGPINIDANGDRATVKMRRDVRLRGEPLNREQRGLRASFLYTGQDLPDGYRFVGYEAGGPKRGPITVAIVKSKVDEGDTGDLLKDVKRLVRDNGGV